LNTNAQNFELGKVSVELNEKVHPKDTAAAAAIIYKSKTYFVYETAKGFLFIMIMKLE
jgi:hypothetical protein